MTERCENCGKFMRPGEHGGSWARRWSYCMDGSPDLHDPVYRCKACTVVHGVPWTNCAPAYPGSGLNVGPAPSLPSQEGES